MKILVIGGCGFIGSHVVDELRAAGHSIRVLDLQPEAFRPPVPDVEYLTGSYTSETLLPDALEGVDRVFHLASATVPGSSNADPIFDIQANLIATVRLLEEMRRRGLRHILYLSSGGTVYGIPRTDPVCEDHPMNPISVYGVVKVAIEKFLYMDQQQHGLRPIVVRPSNPYGPRQGQLGIQGVIGTHLRRIARGEPVEIWGDGSVVRDFIHVRDLAAFCVASGLSEQTGCYNCGSGEGHSILDVVSHESAAVLATTGRPVVPEFRPGRSFDVPRVVLNIDRARQTFGWAPRIGLDDGIAETWDWVRALPV